ncbi:50S ribosomal protein L18 [Thermoproteota archaeon]
MVKSKHIYLLRRRREGKTDYRKRKNILLSKSVFLLPRITSKNICVQISKATFIGDEVIASSHTRELYKLGWKGSGTSLPAAYLTGLIAGLKANKLDIKHAIVYTGLRQYKTGSRISATLKGVTDSGLDIHADNKTFPSKERIKGEHISKYAESLLNADKEMYLRRFSKMIKTGLKPEDYPKHFEEIKKKIIGKYGVDKK